jgi:hypothetical protein
MDFFNKLRKFIQPAINNVAQAVLPASNRQVPPIATPPAQVTPQVDFGTKLLLALPQVKATNPIVNTTRQVAQTFLPNTPINDVVQGQFNQVMPHLGQTFKTFNDTYVRSPEGQLNLVQGFSPAMAVAGTVKKEAASELPSILQKLNPFAKKVESKLPLATPAVQKYEEIFNPILKDIESTKPNFNAKVNLAPDNPNPVVPPNGEGLVTGSKKTSPIEVIFNRTRNVIASQGQAGQQLADKLQQARDIGETLAGKSVVQMPTVAKLPKDQFEHFVDVVEGKAQPTSPVVAQAAKEWAVVRDQIYNQAKQSGVDIGKLEDYFPHSFDPKTFEGDNFAKLAQHLVDTHQATSLEDATQKLRYMQDISHNRVHGNLERSRLVDLPGYEKTKGALFGYVEKAANRIGHVATLGQNDSEAMKLIAQISQQGGDATTTKEMFDIASQAKNYSSNEQNVSGFLRKIQSVGKLGLGAISNASQSVNTAVVTGTRRVLAAMPKALTPEAQDFALRSGVTLDGVIQDLKEGGGFSGKVLGKLTAPGFGNVERFNRTVAAWAGKSYAEDLAKQAYQGSEGAVKELIKMGLDVPTIIKQNGQLTEEQTIKAARNIVERTQFKVDPQDLPGWASSPYGKLFAQFKSFSYNQSAFFKREVLDKASKGDLAPLIRFLVIGSVVGEGVGDAKAFARGRERPQDIKGRLLDNLQTAGGVGTIGDVYNAASRGPDGIMQFIAGPTFGDISKLVGGAGLAAQGKPKTLAKAVLSDVPIIGQTASNVLLPPQNAYQARTPDLPIDNASAAETNPLPQKGKLTPVEEMTLRQQLADINKKQKEIFKTQSGGIPFVTKTLSTDQKNSQLATLQAKEDEINAQLKDPTKETSTKEAEYQLAVDRSKRSDNVNDYLKSTQDYINYLGQYENSLDPTTDQTERLRIQNKIEDLTASKDKYQSYGGFKKPASGATKYKKALTIAKQFAIKTTKSAKSTNPFSKIKPVKTHAFSLKPPKVKRFVAPTFSKKPKDFNLTQST